MLNLVIGLVVSYLMGSVPTSLLAGRLLKGIDIRQHGSGNAGATNTFRVLGWKAGLVVLLIDMAKGLIPTVWVAQAAGSTLGGEPMLYQIACGLAAVFGHIWTIFAGFKGGKGVGTGAGMIIGLAPVPVLICIVVFALVVGVTRYVSLGSILASITLPIVVWTQKLMLGMAVSTPLLVLSIFIPALIIFTHRSNVGRLLRGEESKIQLKKSEA